MPASDGDEIGLAYEIKALLDADVAVEDEAHLAALGERWQGAAKGHDSIALLWVGASVGLGIVAHARLVRGAHGLAGDIGHLPIGPEPSGRAGRRGSFELVASSSGMRLAMASALDRPSETTLTLASGVKQILDAAAWNDPVAERLVDVEAELLAKALLSVVAIADPELIVLAGEIGAHTAMLAPVREATGRCLPVPVPLVSASLGEHAVMIGAVAVAVERARAGLLASSS
jgi:predicted NBD/HSP70 family sugar kinase